VCAVLCCVSVIRSCSVEVPVNGAHLETPRGAQQ
jgi:hypothetical protein